VVARRRDDVVDDPSAALLIRVWLEGSSELRARLMASEAGTAEEVTVAVASSTEDVLAAVRRWLDGFTGDATTRPDGHR
jgi:hypothetical protein